MIFSFCQRNNNSFPMKLFSYKIISLWNLVHAEFYCVDIMLTENGILWDNENHSYNNIQLKTVCICQTIYIRYPYISWETIIVTKYLCWKCSWKAWNLAKCLILTIDKNLRVLNMLQVQFDCNKRYKFILYEILYNS